MPAWALLLLLNSFSVPALRNRVRPTRGHLNVVDTRHQQATYSLKDSVLVLIDIQLGFTKLVYEKLSDPNNYPPRLHAEAIMPNLVDFSRRWLLAGGDVIATQYVNPSDGFSALRKQYGYERFNPNDELGAEQVRLDPRLLAVFGNKSSNGHVYTVEKVTYGSLNADFKALVANKGWKSFVIAGLTTSACVFTTASQMFDHGYNFVLLEDLVADNGPMWQHNFAIEEMKSSFDPYGTGNKVQTTDEFVKNLPDGARQEFPPRGRGIQPLEAGPRAEHEEYDEMFKKHYGYDMHNSTKALAMWGAGG